MSLGGTIKYTSNSPAKPLGKLGKTVQQKEEKKSMAM